MNPTENKVILFVNGDLPAPERIRSEIASVDFLIAVDGGLRHLTRLGLTPNLIIGDLDSAQPGDVERFRTMGVEVRKYPEDKDQTDLELALQAALERYPQSIWVVAALGKRLDQTLGNIFLLTHPNLTDTDIRLVDGQEEVFLIRRAAEIHGTIGDQVSLLPLHGPASGIHTQGLQYPLVGETLYPHLTRGISNRMTHATASVTVESGLLLCIHSLSEESERTKLC